MFSAKSRGLGLVAALLLGGACGPAARVDRTAVEPATGGMTAEGTGGAPGTGGSLPAGTGGLPGTGGTSLGTGGSEGTGGTRAEPDAMPDLTPDLAAPPDLASDVDREDTVVMRAEPLLTVTYGARVASTNLTSAGTVDWLHFGLGGSGSTVNRKRNVPAAITMRKIGSFTLDHYRDRPVTFTWTDGTPTDRATNAPDGVVMGGANGNGFEIRANGDSTKPRTLKLYLGGWQAEARLTAQIGTSPPRMVTESSFSAVDPGGDRVYTITFQPLVDTDTLVVRWTLTDALAQYGNVTIQAATLTE